MHRSARAVGIVAVATLFSLGCSKKEDNAALLPSASALAPSMAAPSAGVVKYTIASKGKTSIDMPAPKERIKAFTEAAGGNLDVDFGNLANTRGSIKVDVADLTTKTFGTDRDADQTKHARTWLEASDTVSADEKEKNRWVVFAIRSIDNLSAPDLSKVVATKEGGDDVRTVTLTAHGDFLLHQRKADKVANLEVKFHYPAGAAADSKPTSIDIKSKEPLKVTLADHDVKPRDTVGKIAKDITGLVGKVADVADVTIDLKATPAG